MKSKGEGYESREPGAGGGKAGTPEAEFEAAGDEKVEEVDFEVVGVGCLFALLVTLVEKLFLFVMVINRAVPVMATSTSLGLSGK